MRNKRLLSSWVLLAVIVPMLVCSSLHVHYGQEGAGAEACAECVHHACHGHIGQHVASVHACVLCQFLTLPLMTAAVVAIIIYNKVCKSEHKTWRRSVCVAHSSVVGLRAPPSV